jgi:solute carrier family 39 (zinc transporter), member 1/2/3
MDVMGYLIWLVALAIFLLSILAGFLVFRLAETQQPKFHQLVDAMVSGVFFGAGLMCFLPEAGEALGYGGFCIAGLMYLFFLWLEHLSRETSRSSHWLAVMPLVLMMSHAWFEGCALGLSDTYAVFSVVAIAILSHKFFESFAIAVHIQKTFKRQQWYFAFVLFCIMTPLGMLSTQLISSSLSQTWVGVAQAISAGTFLYLGTLFGLKRSVLVKQCCDLKQFGCVVFGFSLMSLIAFFY